MHKIQASEANAHLPQLLDEVDRGESRVPEADLGQEEVDRALASILELRKRAVKVTVEEIRFAREEGRNY